MPPRAAMPTVAEALDPRTADDIGIADYLDRVISEYRDMPGLSLTARQMQRLLAIEASVCDALIDALVAARVLRRTPSGTIVRVS